MGGQTPGGQGGPAENFLPLARARGLRVFRWLTRTFPLAALSPLLQARLYANTTTHADHGHHGSRRRRDDRQRGRGHGGGGAVPRREAAGNGHRRRRHQEAEGGRHQHGRSPGPLHQEGAVPHQRHLRGQSRQDAAGSLEAGADGLHDRVRRRGAARRPDHGDDGRQRVGRHPGRRHRDGVHHRDLRRVPVRQNAAVPHPVRDVPAAHRHGRRRGQGPVHRHGGHVPAATLGSDRGTLRPQPVRRPGQRRVRARPQHRPPGPAPAGGGVHDGGSPVRAHRRRLGHGPVPHGVQRPRRAVGPPDPLGPLPALLATPGRRVWLRRRRHQPGGGRELGWRGDVCGAVGEAHRREHCRARDDDPPVAEERAGREPHVQDRGEPFLAGAGLHVCGDGERHRRRDGLRCGVT